MKQRAFFILQLALTGLSLIGCIVQHKSTATTQSSSMVVQGPLWGAVWQQKAAEYKALCYQAYNIARLRLELELQHQHSRPIAVVTDIDETALDNSPYAIHQALKDSSYNDKSWMEWTSKSACDTVPGALDFFKFAFSKGVRIFYITNRLEAERQATEKDLQRWGFPDATPDHLFLKQTTSGKEQRRSIVAKDYEIVLLCGDNLSDFSAIFDKQNYAQRNTLTMNSSSSFGNKFIVLPNSTYGDWEGALHNFNFNLRPSQRDSIIQSQLRTY